MPRNRRLVRPHDRRRSVCGSILSRAHRGGWTKQSQGARSSVMSVPLTEGKARGWQSGNRQRPKNLLVEIALLHCFPGCKSKFFGLRRFPQSIQREGSSPSSCALLADASSAPPRRYHHHNPRAASEGRAPIIAHTSPTSQCLCCARTSGGAAVAVVPPRLPRPPIISNRPTRCTFPGQRARACSHRRRSR